MVGVVGLFLKWCTGPKVGKEGNSKRSAVKSEHVMVSQTGVTSAHTGEDTEAEGQSLKKVKNDQLT